MFASARLLNGFASYQNPVVHGDFPDPSIVRVGEQDFYAVTTSTEWAPYFPIFHSRDLVTWSRVGAVFSSRPQWAAGQFWAPELSFRDGTYFVYYSARRRNGPLTIAVATALHPLGPWRDHGPLVGQDAGSIDATTAIEDGKPWLIWKEDGNASGRPTTLWAQALSHDGRALLGSRHALLRNDSPWEDHVIEAPCVVARRGWFYLFYSGNSCCGETCKYAVGVARARSLTGSWTKAPLNPLLAENRAFRGPGHGSCVTTADGRMFYLYHAYANVANATSVGRELMLDEIVWGPDEWPSINAGAGPSRRAPTPFGRITFGRDRTPFEGNFRRPLDPMWQWPQHMDRQAEVDRRRGLAILRTSRRRADPLSSVMARPARSLDYTAIAVVEQRDCERGVMASLAAYGNGANALGIGVRDGRLWAWRRIDGRWTEQELGRAPNAGRIYLRLDAVWGKAYWVSYGLNGRRWNERTSVLDGTHLPPWDRGVRIALCAGGAPGKSAAFRSLRITDVPATIHRLATRRVHASYAKFDRSNSVWSNFGAEASEANGLNRSFDLTPNAAALRRRDV